jgi:hypothetical protein
MFTITLTSNTGDPVAAVQDLAMDVIEMNLQNGIVNSLDSKLDTASFPRVACVGICRRK